MKKFLVHERDKAGDFQRRVLLHIPIGFVMAIPVLGWPLIKLFEFYEKNEDLHTQDQAWKDVFGAMVGFVVGILFWFLLLAILFFKWG